MTNPRLIFVNLPVADLEAARRFFTALGLTFDERFSDDTAACLVINEGASYAMLLTREKFAGFSGKPVGDPAEQTSVMIAVSADDRAAVDGFADAALAAGASHAQEPIDYGFMYSRSFYDLDGHHWEVVWMSPEAVEAGPAEHAAQGASSSA